MIKKSFRRFVLTSGGFLFSAIMMLAGCTAAPSGKSPATPLSFKYDNGAAAEITIGRYTDTLGGKQSSASVPIVCQSRTQQAAITSIQGQVYIYCSFPMGPANPAAYENDQPTAYQTVTLGQTANGAFKPALRFGMVDDDRDSTKGMASYVPGLYDGAIEYYGMYARPGTTYDFKIQLDLEKGRARVWVAGRGDDEWFPLANDAKIINPVTAINAVRIDQLPRAAGVENLMIQSNPWPEGEKLRPNPMAKKNRIVGLGKGFKFQQMKSLWRDASRHVTVARTPNVEKLWWLGFTDVTQVGPNSLIACYNDGVAHGGCGNLWAMRSDDLGKTWGDPVIITLGPANSPRVQKLRDGTLLVVVGICTEHSPIHFFGSTDEGGSWSQLGKLDAVAIGAPESVVPSRVLEMPDGSWLLVTSSTPGTAWHLTEGEILEFYRSSDCGKTWAHHSTLRPPYPLGLSEASIVPLPDGRLILFAREGSSFIPGVRSFSSDQGKTWSIPEEMPFLISGRTCAAMLKGGRVLLTFRNHMGLPDLWAWAADPDEKSRPLVHGSHINDQSSVGLKEDGLYIDSDGRCGQFTSYRFRPPDSDQSRIEATVEVKVISNAGLAATLSVPFVGKLRFFPDKVCIVNESSSEIAVNTSEFHTYRIISEGPKLTLFIDGRQAFTADNRPRKVVPQAWSPQKLSPYALEFGNEFADDSAAAFDWVPGSVREQTRQPQSSDKAPATATLKTITPAVTGCSVWRRFDAKYDDPRTGARTVSWSADGGEFPDQYQLDRLVEIDGTIAGWDQGYSGWTQLEDGRIFIVNYTDDTARWNRWYPNGGTSWIRGTVLTPAELP
jgi:hypothetical protein